MALPSDLAKITAIELAIRFPDYAQEEATSAVDLYVARFSGHLWVARRGMDVVGFVLIKMLTPGSRTSSGWMFTRTTAVAALAIAS